jgi:hypothetical protein
MASFVVSIRKSAVVVSDDYKALSMFGQEMRLNGIKGVTVTRWTGQSRPKYATLATAQSMFGQWVANETYLPDIDDNNVADYAEEANAAMRGF